MPYTPTTAHFLDAAGVVADRYETRIDEPPSGTAVGETLTLSYTPRSAGERLRAGLAGGPPGRTRLEVSVDGGPWLDPSSAPVALGTAGVEQEIRVRAVGVPFAGDDSEVSTHPLVATKPGEAAWLA